MMCWLLKLIKIVRSYELDRAVMRERIGELETLVRERTDIGVDIELGRSAPNHIIVIGRYRNSDYVQTYSVSDRDLEGIISLLDDLRKHGSVRFVDSVPKIRAVVRKDSI